MLWYYLGNVGLSLCTVDAFGKSLISLMNFGPVGAPPSEKKIKKYFWLEALLLQNYNTILNLGLNDKTVEALSLIHI